MFPVSIPQSEFCPLGLCASHCACEIHSVSIPQSEFCPLGPPFGRFTTGSLLIVSIPQSEFCPLGLPERRSIIQLFLSFNSSVGILSVGTSIPGGEGREHGRFQFLSRNSVRWDHKQLSLWLSLLLGFNSSVGILSVGTLGPSGIVSKLASVSIPQSEFCPLGHVETNAKP